MVEVVPTTILVPGGTLKVMKIGKTPFGHSGINIDDLSHTLNDC